MRRLAAVAAAALVVVPSALAAPGNADVAALQVALKARGLYAGTIDGFHGPVTDAAARRLAGAARAGDALSVWRARLGPYGRHVLGSRVLRPGTSGWDVAAFKFLLAWRGFPSGPLDGRYTERTAVAVRKFQLAAGLEVDGAAGPATIGAVRRPAPQPPRLLRHPVDARPDGFFGPRGSRFHSGIDYPVARGTAVAAASAGRVAFAGWDAGGYGYVVVLDHGNGFETLYAHLSRVGVRRGASVAAGATVGLAGASGIADGPHLHFEVRLRGGALDPALALPHR